MALLFRLILSFRMVFNLSTRLLYFFQKHIKAFSYLLVIGFGSCLFVPPVIPDRELGDQVISRHLGRNFFFHFKDINVVFVSILTVIIDAIANVGKPRNQDGRQNILELKPRQFDPEISLLLQLSYCILRHLLILIKVVIVEISHSGFNGLMNVIKIKNISRHVSNSTFDSDFDDSLEKWMRSSNLEIFFGLSLNRLPF